MVLTCIDNPDTGVLIFGLFLGMTVNSFVNPAMKRTRTLPRRLINLKVNPIINIKFTINDRFPSPA
jgi:hypothetical protein